MVWFGLRCHADHCVTSRKPGQTPKLVGSEYSLRWEIK